MTLRKTQVFLFNTLPPSSANMGYHALSDHDVAKARFCSVPLNLRAREHPLTVLFDRFAFSESGAVVQFFGRDIDGYTPGLIESNRGIDRARARRV